MPAATTSLSSLDVELFLSRDGKRIKSLNLHDQGGQSDCLLFEGLEGGHDLYATVGTSGEVKVDILFEKDHWRYDPEAG